MSSKLDEKTLKEFLECVYSGQRGDIKGCIGMENGIPASSYPMAERCLDFTALIKTKIDDNLKQVLSIAMGEAFDQGYERGRGSIEKEKALTAQEIKKAYDKGYKDGKKDGIQEGIDTCTSAINFLGNTDEKIIYDIFCINPNITEYPFDYVLDNYDMNTIVTKVNDYIKQQNEPRNAASRLIVDISNKFNIPVADVVKIIGIYEDNNKSTE